MKKVRKKGKIHAKKENIPERERGGEKERETNKCFHDISHLERESQDKKNDDKRRVLCKDQRRWFQTRHVQSADQSGGGGYGSGRRERGGGGAEESAVVPKHISKSITWCTAARRTVPKLGEFFSIPTLE